MSARITCRKCGVKTKVTPSISRHVHKFGQVFKCVCGNILDIPKEKPEINMEPEQEFRTLEPWGAYTK